MKAFWLKGHHGFENIEAWDLYGFAKKSSAGPGSNYTDSLRFRDVYLRDPHGSDWIVDVGYLGDDLVVEGLRCSGDPENRNVLRVSRTKGARILGSINNNMLFEGCRAVTVANFHLEDGWIEARGCGSITFADGYIQRREETQRAYDPVSGGDLGFSAPLRVWRITTSGRAGPCSIRNVEVVTPDTGEGQALEYANTDMPDLVVDDQAELTVENFTRAYDGQSSGIGQHAGALITRYGGASPDNGAPWPRWSNVSHMASKRSVLAAGSISLGATHSPIPANYIFSEVVSSSSGTFKAASGTYRYAFEILHGPADRRIARRISEKTFNAVQDGNAALFSFSETGSGRPGYTNTVLRAYRGDPDGAADVYTKMVEISIIDRLSFFDFGYFTDAGLRWQDRMEGDVDAANTDASFNRVEMFNDINCIVYGTTVLPEHGAWVAGDLDSLRRENSRSDDAAR